eukprot:UN27294
MKPVNKLYEDLKKIEILYEDLKNKCAQFEKTVCKFPIQHNHIINQKLFKKEKIVEHAKSARIVIHKDVADLLTKFLVTKRKHGDKYEKEIYKEPFDEIRLMGRLIKNRP